MKKRKVVDDTLVSVLIESGLVDQKAILGALAERGGGDAWLADHLVQRGVITRGDMDRALGLISDLRSNPSKVQYVRVEMVKLRMRKLGKAHEANAKACRDLQVQSKRISDEFPSVAGLVKVGTGD